MNLAQAIDRYVIYLRAERNLAPRTVAAYRYELDRFLVFSHAPGAAPPPLGDINAWMLKDYLAGMQEERELKPATRSRTTSSMRSFFKWALHEGLIAENPAAKLKTPKKARRLPIYLTAPEARRMGMTPPPEEKTSLRDRTILVLLVMSGMRLSELVGLDLESLDLSSGFLRVVGKGRKERLIPLNEAVRNRLALWLAERPTSPSGCRALFLARDGGRISPRTVQYLVKKAAARAGLDPRISPHKLRHTFATNLYAEGTELRDVQELLGHSNITSTAIYTHTNVDRLRDAVSSLKA